MILDAVEAVEVLFVVVELEDIGTFESAKEPNHALALDF